MLEIMRNTPAGAITGNGQTVGPLDIGGFTNILVMIQGTYTGVNIVWEASMDGAAWVGVQGVRSDAGTAELNSGSLGTTSRAWDIYVGPFNFFRVRSTAWTSGAATIWMVADNSGVDPVIVATVAGQSAVVGTSSHSGNINTYPVCVGGQAKSAIDTTLVDGDASYLTLTTARQVVTKDFGSAENDLQVSGSVTTTGSAVAAFGAAGASIRNYVTGLQAQNISATATTLLIQDGATTIWQCNLPANMDKPINIVFPTPLKGTANTAMNHNFGTAGANVLLNIQGFKNF